MLSSTPSQPAGVVVALVEFDQRQVIGPVAVDLVRAGKAEGRFPAEIARRYQQVHGAQSVHVEIVVGNGRRFVVGRLRGGVNDKLRPFAFEYLPDRLAVPDIDWQVPVMRQGCHQFLYNRVRGALRAKELPAHIVVDPDDFPAFGRELADTFRADQPAGSQ
jgi:hypothetical protein